MNAKAHSVALCVWFGVNTTCIAQDLGRLTPAGESLIADFPVPASRESDVSQPCVDNSETTTESDELYAVLTSRRAYLFALTAWGVKWFPKHVPNPKYRWMGLCTDDAFLLREFKKATGRPVSSIWTRYDVSRLIELVERRALELSGSGQLGDWILEPGYYR